MVSLQAQEIFVAIKSGNLNEVQKLISSNQHIVDSLDERGNTPLMSAIGLKNIEITKYLIAEGSNINFKNKSGNTPLHLAADRNLIDVVNLLLEKGSEINAANNYQMTPLFSAIERNNVDVARILLDHSANVNFNSPVFGCPIHRVIYVRSPELLNLLLTKKVKLEAKDANGKTALHLAGMLGRSELANILINNGAELNSKDKKGITPLHYAIMHGQDRDGKNRSSELAELLVNKGANVNTISEDGVTPIFSAARNGYTDIVKLLHKKGGDVKSISKDNSQTLLHVASIKGYGDLVEYLLAHGVNKNQKDLRGRTASDYALKFGHERIAQILLDKNSYKKSETGSKFLNAEISDSEAYIWSLNNRGWAIKTAEHLFIFDNEENGRKPDQPSVANGWISAKEIRDQNVIALYSAYHALPNTMEFIHSIEDSLKQIVYFHYKEDEWRGGKNSRYLLGREIQKIGETEIIPYETHDSHKMGSLGYLVKTKGLTFFYPNFFPEDTALFQKEINFLSEQCTHCDFAIIEVTPGAENVYASYIIEKLKPKMVIPYDRSGKIESYVEFKKEISKKYPTVKVHNAENSGERLYYKK
jgi:ankyrin repeat protein